MVDAIAPAEDMFLIDDQYVPNPGSPAAKEQGCLCPVLSNGRGFGKCFGEKRTFEIAPDCPMHGAALNKEGLAAPRRRFQRIR